MRGQMRIGKNQEREKEKVESAAIMLVRFGLL